MRIFNRVVMIGCVSALCCGCSSLSRFTTPKTPDFYPNEKLLRTPPEVVKADEGYCLDLADQYIKEPSKYQGILEDGAIGGAIGAGTGAIGGAIMGNAGAATGAGAAMGGLLGVLKGLKDMNERSPSFERFVEHCLQQKGYEIIGWSSKS